MIIKIPKNAFLPADMRNKTFGRRRTNHEKRMKWKSERIYGRLAGFRRMANFFLRMRIQRNMTFDCRHICPCLVPSYPSCLLCSISNPIDIVSIFSELFTSAHFIMGVNLLFNNVSCSTHIRIKPGEVDNCCERNVPTCAMSSCVL